MPRDLASGIVGAYKEGLNMRPLAATTALVAARAAQQAASQCLVGRTAAGRIPTPKRLHTHTPAPPHTVRERADCRAHSRLPAPEVL